MSSEAYAASHIKIADSGCWEWTGSKTTNGYGMARYAGVRQMAHRLVYELHREPIPSGLVIDHLCRNRICVNPDHLEPVTTKENLRRGMSPMAVAVRTGKCKRNHDLSGDNLYVSPRGVRKCRACLQLLRAERYQRDKKALGIPDFRPRGECNEPGCTAPHYGRGLCKRHWARVARQA